MYMVEVGSIPERKHCGRRHNMYDWLDKFVAMNVKYVKIVFDNKDYANVNSAYTNLYQSAKYGGFDIQVIRRDDEIYLMRTDI